MEDVVTAEEAARLLKVHPKTIQKWCREGRLQSIRVGNRYRLRKADLRTIDPGSVDKSVKLFTRPDPPPTTGQARIVAVTNQKGGVGKTTTTQALGAVLADLGQRVLLVDLDPQASLTTSLGIPTNELSQTVYSVISQFMGDDGTFDTREAIVPLDSWLALLPSNINLSAAEVTLPNQVRREYVLGEILAPIRHEYDWIFIDCPPSLSLLTINALTCADTCIVPVAPEPLVTVGVGLLFQTVARVRRTKLNPTLGIDGIILTKVDARPTLTRGVIDDLRATLDGRVPILGEIRSTIRVQEASASGVPLTRFRAAADAVTAYREIAEVLRAARQAK